MLGVTIFVKCIDICRFVYVKVSVNTVKIRVLEPSCLGTCWQKFAILKPPKIRTCLAKQDHAGRFLYLGYSQIIDNHFFLYNQTLHT